MRNAAILTLLCCIALIGYCHADVKVPSSTNIKAYYTCLPFDGPKERQSNDANVSLKMNDKAKTRGGDFKAGIEMAVDGSYSLVIWMKYSSNENCFV